MMEEVLSRYLHFMGILILASCLVAEHILIARNMDLKTFKKLVIVDAIYGLGALLTLTGGLLLWFSFGKASAFYSGNFVFHIKLSLFFVAAFLSIFPTVYFIKNRNTDVLPVTIPRYIINIIRIELLIIVVIPFTAVLMARGIGLT